MSFVSLPTAPAAEIDRTASTPPAEAEEIAVELAITAHGRVAPSPAQAGGTSPYVGIKMTLQRVDSLEPLRKLLPEGWTLTTNRQTERKQ